MRGKDIVPQMMLVSMYRCHMNGDIANIKHVDKENR